MHKVLFVGISMWVFAMFGITAQAEGDCGGGHQQTVSVPAPVMTVDSATTTRPSTTKTGG